MQEGAETKMIQVVGVPSQSDVIYNRRVGGGFEGFEGFERTPFGGQ